MENTRDERDVVREIVEAVLSAVKPLLGENVRQADLAAALGENASSLSRLTRGDNSSATKPMQWIAHWNANHPEQKLIFVYDGTTPIVKVVTPAANAAAPPKKRRGEVPAG